MMGTGRIPKLRVFLNSATAINTTETFCKHHKEHKLNDAQCALIDDKTEFVRTVEETIELDAVRYPRVIMSASALANGEGGCCTA